MIALLGSPEALPGLLYCAGTAAQAAAAARPLLALSRASSATYPLLAPGQLTVLQPILGGDPALEDCLVRTAAQCAPAAQFVWLVDEDDPMGISATERALERLSAAARNAVAVRIVPPIDELARGAQGPINPKSAKLAVALRGVETPLVAVLDDDTTVGPEHLARARRSLENGADLYTGLPSYRAEGTSLGSMLVAGFVNSSGARTYLSALSLGPPTTINGMFWVTRTATLRELGGFQAVQHQLCDDLAIAELYQQGAKRLDQGATAQVLVSRGLALGSHVSRMHRWFVFARVLFARASWRVRAPLVLFGLGMPCLLVATLAMGLMGGAGAWLLVVSLLMRHATLAVLLGCAADPSSLYRARLPFVASVVAEVMLPFHALHALLVPSIVWRTRRYRVGATGQFTVQEQRG